MRQNTSASTKISIRCTQQEKDRGGRMVYLLGYRHGKTPAFSRFFKDFCNGKLKIIRECEGGSILTYVTERGSIITEEYNLHLTRQSLSDFMN